MVYGETMIEYAPPPERQVYCCRTHSGNWGQLAAPGSGFCQPCLEWMLGQRDVDPIGKNSGRT